MVFAAATATSVDLSLNPSLPQAQWGTVQVDCNVNSLVSGITSIGPMFGATDGGKRVGGVYVEQSLWTTCVNAGQLPLHEIPGTDSYQTQTVVRPNANGNLDRWYGYKMGVREQRASAAGGLTRVDIYRWDNELVNTMWIDLNDATVCDPPANGMTTVTTATAVGNTGPVFLTWTAIQAIGLELPKFPKGLGGVTIPNLGEP